MEEYHRRLNEGNASAKEENFTTLEYSQRFPEGGEPAGDAKVTKPTNIVSESRKKVESGRVENVMTREYLKRNCNEV